MMKIEDIGTLSGDVLLFGGVYSNLPAFEALIDEAKRLDISPQNMICTGDLVAYCADAQACVQRAILLGCPTICGNCEVQLARAADDCGCGFEEGSHCSILSRGWYAFASQQISPSSRTWMAALPDHIVFTHEGLRYGVVHGSASEIARFIWPVTPDAEIAAEISLLETQTGPLDCVVAGHTGIAMTRAIGAKNWINSGAIGMPANDGQQNTSYVLLRNGIVEIRRLEYDVQKTVRTMENAGLTQGYHQALITGFWPSQDILPVSMRHNSSPLLMSENIPGVQGGSAPLPTAEKITTAG